MIRKFVEELSKKGVPHSVLESRVNNALDDNKRVESLIALKARAALLLDEEKEEQKEEVHNLADVERLHILKVFNIYLGNKTYTAKALGITTKTLYNKLHEYGIMEK